MARDWSALTVLVFSHSVEQPFSQSLSLYVQVGEHTHHGFSKHRLSILKEDGLCEQVRCGFL